MKHQKLGTAVVALVVVAVAIPSGACASLVGADFDDWRTSAASDTDGAARSDDGATEPEPGSPGARDDGGMDGGRPVADGGPTVVDGGADSAAPGCSPSCQGCCNGGTCEVGTKAEACGVVGGQCNACAVDSICLARACTPTTLICLNYTSGLRLSCNELCTAKGKTCSRGCWPDSPNRVGQVQPGQVCDRSEGVAQVTGCDDEPYIYQGEKLGCCCR